MKVSARAWKVGALPLLAACLFAACGLASAQYADLDRADWKEDVPPPPPAYSTQGLVELDMPRGSTVRMGVDPATIHINQQTGIVRYVVVARGPSAVNASYEGIRCATGEYRIYARQVQGSEWSPNSDDHWNSMRGQSGVLVQHPGRLAQGGMCMGTALRETAAEMVRQLKSGNQSLYY